jgi:hypothetical protein
VPPLPTRPTPATAPDPYRETLFVDPGELAPYPGNPNHGDVDAIRGSVRRNGQYRAVVARVLPDGTLQLLAGHATTEATGAEVGKVRVEVIDVDDATARRIVAADNALPARATMDESALFALLDAANADGGLEGTGVDDVEFRNLVDRHMGSSGRPPAEAPGEFASYDEETIPVAHECPRCGFRWSGDSAPRTDPDADEGGEQE